MIDVNSEIEYHCENGSSDAKVIHMIKRIRELEYALDVAAMNMESSKDAGEIQYDYYDIDEMRSLIAKETI